MTRYTIRISEDADRDLDEISEFIASDDSNAAERWRRQVHDKIDRLSDYPRLGQERPALMPGLRTLAFGRYVICYRVLDDQQIVEIGRVLHAARDFPAIFP